MFLAMVLRRLFYREGPSRAPTNVSSLLTGHHSTHGSGQVFFNLVGRVGPSQEVFEIPRIELDRVRRFPNRTGRDLTPEK